MPGVITSRAVAPRMSRVSCANPLQTMSRSVTMPISRSFSPIGMAPMSCSHINFASSVTGVSGLTQSTPLCIASFTFMADLRCWIWVHSMQCSGALPPVGSTIPPIGSSAAGLKAVALICPLRVRFALRRSPACDRLWPSQADMAGCPPDVAEVPAADIRAPMAGLRGPISVRHQPEALLARRRPAKSRAETGFLMIERHPFDVTEAGDRRGAARPFVARCAENESIAATADAHRRPNIPQGQHHCPVEHISFAFATNLCAPHLTSQSAALQEFQTGLMPAISFGANRRIALRGAHVVALGQGGKDPEHVWGALDWTTGASDSARRRTDRTDCGPVAC